MFKHSDPFGFQVHDVPDKQIRFMVTDIHISDAESTEFDAYDSNVQRKMIPEVSSGWNKNITVNVF